LKYDETGLEEDIRPGRQNTIDLKETCCGVEITNKFVLWVSALSFSAFVCAEIIGALASNSLSLLGDASAMSVDVFTVMHVAIIKR
jgi:Co/Zn/Cd efflux system component